MTALTEAALKNADILRDLEAAPPADGAQLAQLARHWNRSEGHKLKRTLNRMAEDGLVSFREHGEGVAIALTHKGRRAIAAMAVADRDADPEAAGLTLPRERIRFNPFNPRKAFRPDEIERFAESIAETGCDPEDAIEVFPAGEDGVHDLADGERRLRAIDWLTEQARREADRPIPVRLKPRSPEDVEAATLHHALIKNEARAGLAIYEKAQTFFRLHVLKGMSARALALKYEEDVRSVQEWIQVLRDAAPDDIAAHLRDPEANPFEWLKKQVQTPKPAAVESERLTFAGGGGGSFGAGAGATAMPDGEALLRLLKPDDKGVLLDVAHAAHHGPRHRSKMHAVDGLGFTRVVQAPSSGADLDVPTRRMLGLYSGLNEKPPVCLGIEDAVFGPGGAGVWLTSEGRAVVRRLAPVLLNLDAPKAEADAALREAREKLGHGQPAKPHAYLSEWLYRDLAAMEPTAPVPAAGAAGADDQVEPPVPLTRLEALGLVETGHKIQEEGEVFAAPAGFSAVVGDFSRSAVAQGLVRAGLIAINAPAKGLRWRVALTSSGKTRLAQELGVEPEPGRAPGVGPELLAQARDRAGGLHPTRRAYVTDFLNDPEPVARPQDPPLSGAPTPADDPTAADPAEDAWDPVALRGSSLIDGEALARRLYAEIEPGGSGAMIISLGARAFAAGQDVARRRLDGLRACRVCGCIDEAACEGGCAWAAEDVCSACAPFLSKRPAAAAESPAQAQKEKA